MKKLWLICPLMLFLFVPQFALSQDKPSVIGAVEDAFVKEDLQEIVSQLAANTKSLNRIRENLFQAIGTYQSKDKTNEKITDINNIEIIINCHKNLSTGFECQTELLDMAKMIKPAHKLRYYTQRITALKSLKENASFTNDKIEQSYQHIKNRTVLQMVDRAKDNIQTTSRMFNDTIVLLKSISILIDQIKRIQPSVAEVMCYGMDNKPLARGTGFFINYQGHLVTNFHIFKGAYRAEIKDHDGNMHPVKLVIGENGFLDLLKIVVGVPDDALHRIKAVKKLPKIDERIFIVGSASALGKSSKTGFVTAVRNIPMGGKIFPISAYVPKSMSGSPAINPKGEVIGIISYHLSEYHNTPSIVPSNYILESIKDIYGRTVSEWTNYHLNKGKLTVKTKPVSATVKILNIKEKFYQGIALDPGSYLLEVSAKGYQTVRKRINIAPREKIVKTIRMKRHPWRY